MNVTKKRFWSGLLSVILLLGILMTGPASAAAVSSAGVVWGDIDGKEGITASDALMVLQHSVQLITLTGTTKIAADVSADGNIDAADALLILQYSVQLITKFPAESGEGLVSNPWSSETMAYKQSTEAFDAGEIRTTFQQSASYSQTFDVPSDSTMVYLSTIGETQGAYYKSWKNASNSAAKSLDIMIPGGRDNGSEYYSMYPERGDKDAQKNYDGSIRYHTPPVAYMMPTRYYAEYKWQLVEACCELGPGFITIEEPECWLEGGYNEGFKEEWQSYYNEEWQDPASSPEARYKASKLMAQLWIDMITMIGERMHEKYPEIGLVIATHSGPNYIRHGIAAAINSYTNIPYVTGIIAQVWSDTIAVPVNYAGQYQERAFEAGFLGYASFPDSMQPGQVLYSLTDAKADNPAFDWDKCRYLWKKSTTSQLMQSGIHNFQECVWPSRGFTPAPQDFKTSQLNLFQVMRDIGGNQTNLYAGTPGISVALGDSFTWQKNYSNWMATGSSQNALYGMTIPLIERGIPVSVTSLDYLESPADLKDVKVLLLSYDVNKPLSEKANAAIAEWVKQGGTVLYLGGRDDYDAIPDEWWSDKKQTPFENLIGHLGLDISVTQSDSFEIIEWCGNSGYGQSIHDIYSMINLSDFTNFFTGTGFQSIMKMGEETVGFDAKVGKGHFISVGMPASYYADNEQGPQQLRELVEYAVQYTDVSYYETTLMTMQRGEYIIAESLLSSQGESLTGDFIDLFDCNLSVISKKEMGSNDSALLLDLTKFRTEGTPRLAFTGGDVKGEISETADTTTFTISGPSEASSATRLLGNGRYPKSVTASVGDKRYGDFVSMWDNETASLLIQTTHTPTEQVTFTITWSDEQVETTEPYYRATYNVKTNVNNEDAPYIVHDSAEASRSIKRCEYGSELIYQFDTNEYPDAFVDLTVFYNYKIDVSTDNKEYQTIASYDGEYTTNATNRKTVRVFLSDYVGSGGKVYVRLGNVDPSKQYGTGISAFAINCRKPLVSDTK